ncbi:hypothetical protein EGT74_09020 [Chitinophaga lutea]|uniref:Outer membrane protein beta-barrel domain-containing protein n=1 Tax=Chitinophaga lutea TaxID=2488634 RepID=A0A3N4QCE6_9BACT|nr:outer membrane beta-barrel protein [Chitinophaga lutea]RPE13637.1 hypothetical protein EGT74_09020 [Chitinophaga lutea]
MSEQFENSIRKKLQEADVPFDPAAWDQMKKRLDDSGRRRGAFYWWTAGLLLLLGLGSWWWFLEQQPVDKNESDRISVTDSLNKAGAHSPETQENIKDRPATPHQTPAAGISLPGASGTIEPATSAGIDVDKPAGNNTATPSASLALTPAKKNTTIVDNLQQRGVTTAKTENNQTTVDNTAPKNPVAPVNIVPTPAGSTKDSSKLTAGVNNPKATNIPSVKTTPAPANPVNDSSKITAAVDNPVQEKKKKQKRGFDAGITLGPDYNAVPSLKHGRIGFGGGLLIRYHINNNFYLSTGASYNKKLYGAEDKDYDSPYPTYYKKIDADCNVLDVPLNVHYTFLHKPKSTWSAMVGASSYFMIKEKYEYYTLSGGKYKREFNNSNQHYFSVLNLGVNYERNTKGVIQWGVQPYVKLPLGGVGAGNVKLLSAGVSFQVTVGKKD